MNDTRLVQKEINSLDGKVERCFISIDELMFRVFKINYSCIRVIMIFLKNWKSVLQVARKDEIVRKCYKLLAAIHTNSSSIIASVKQTGTIGREIKDLEEQARLLDFFVIKWMFYFLLAFWFILSVTAICLIYLLLFPDWKWKFSSCIG